MRRKLRIVIPLAAGSVIALIGGLMFAGGASAVHNVPAGGTPFRLPIVPHFKECTSPTGSLHGGGLPIKTGCNNPALDSQVAKLGTSSTAGTRVGVARLDVCFNTTFAGCTQLTAGQVPDVRIRGNSSDVLCSHAAQGGANDPCPGGVGSDYDPRPGAGPYLWGLDPGVNSNTSFPSINATANSNIPCDPSPPNPNACGGFAPSGATGIADMVATATIPKAAASIQGNAIRVTDHWNSQQSTGDPAACTTSTTCTATVVDQPFPVPVVCKSNTDATLGSYCGLNTTANALVPDVVESNKAGVVEVGQIQINDVGLDGANGTTDDKTFGVQGLFIP